MGNTPSFDDSSKWQIEFNYKVMPYLMGLTSQFTTYSLYDCGKINSVRVIRLYESLCQYRSSRVWVTTQEWLSERFMLPESQRSNFAEMKRTFINPALKKSLFRILCKCLFSEVTVQAVTELDNKAAHCHSPVLQRHRPFPGRRLDCQPHHFFHRVVCREHFTLFDRMADHAV